LNVLKTTLTNKPRLENKAWWYLTPTYSFGFAHIKQDASEKSGCIRNRLRKSFYSNCKDEQRLSWALTGIGGWRLGFFKFFNYFI